MVRTSRRTVSSSATAASKRGLPNVRLTCARCCGVRRPCGTACGGAGGGERLAEALVLVHHRVEVDRAGVDGRPSRPRRVRLPAFLTSLTAPSGFEPDRREALLLGGARLLGEPGDRLLADLEVLAAEVDEEVVARGDDARLVNCVVVSPEKAIFQSRLGSLSAPLLRSGPSNVSSSLSPTDGRRVVEEDAQRGVDLGAGERLDARQRLLRGSSPRPVGAAAGGHDDGGREGEQEQRGAVSRAWLQSGTGSGRATGPRTGPERQVETVGPGAQRRPLAPCSAVRFIVPFAASAARPPASTWASCCSSP